MTTPRQIEDLLAFTANFILAGPIGSVLLFYSFQATSTNFLLVTTPDDLTALCVDDYALLIAGPKDRVRVGSKCPEAATAKSTAVANTENPRLAPGGFLCILVGFLSQLFSIECSQSPRFRAESRRA